MWRALRSDALDGLKFRRQQPIGRYIVDFYCPPAKLVVEIDGATHVDNAADGLRDDWLATQGIRVLRLWNNEVMGNLPGVLASILAAARTPPPRLPPQGREEKKALPPCGGGLGGGLPRPRR